MALIELIKQNHPESAFSLLEQNPDLAEEVGEDGVSAALQALYHGQRELAKAILSQKHTLNIFEAAAFGKISELESLCENTDATLCYSSDGFQPLHLAAFFGRLEAVNLLLSFRAPLNQLSQNAQGVAPLHSALAHGHESVARELVFEGADVNLSSSSGWTPLHYAAHQGNKPLLLFLREHGAVPAAGPDNKTPRDLAIEANFQDLADFI